jgi:hypothetical protein
MRLSPKPDQYASNPLQEGLEDLSKPVEHQSSPSLIASDIITDYMFIPLMGKLGVVLGYGEGC